MTPVERDAARYRWLATADRPVDQPHIHFSSHGDECLVLVGRKSFVDEMIDAAMEAEPRYTITDAGRALIAGTD